MVFWKGDVGMCFINHFNEVFTSSMDLSTSLDIEVSQLFSHFTSNNENEALCSILEGKKDVIFHMGSYKVLGSDGLSIFFYKILLPHLGKKCNSCYSRFLFIRLS